MVKTVKHWNIFRLGLVLLFCVSFFYLINLITYPTANYFIRKEMVNWTMYEGFAENTFYIYIIVIAIYTFYKPYKQILFTAIMAFGIYILLSIFIYTYEDYMRFYVETDVNGKYSFDHFFKSVKNHFSYIFTSDVCTFLVTKLWQLLNIWLVIFINSKPDFLKIKNEKYLEL